MFGKKNNMFGKKINYTAIENLRDMLDMCNIPYAFYPHEMGEGYHLCYPNHQSNECVCSVILNPFSYGAEYGRLEIMGLLTKEESEQDSVVGYLSEAEVFTRIYNHYKEHFE